ncbi:hypothetical protein C1Y08_24970 [Pseudomonas sp. FW306-02-F02-AA]|uniref:Uncharacterized protein n=1 Tax=Pseudomonas fluorescens TaxID=294 RepID=A0A0N9X194_PSEFL|nr:MULTISPECIES: hypothetical protein [Pseudomonas]ALI04335.1 hypothetical protein AO353_25925 [Pseudomonas fluorescens]PMZ01648.1 hypothetical protein C1Y07_24145 [Pseudomonas sp. FW306-02-F02-AB]PMZ10141.1 hypothetical protein C1Y06_10965 [Pseudomonas sp. FW306-02-H06C]PMZ13200.1 hypothetical protein C1Y08_24970 [Pseudomonas sp. FW306-02-F02-AA]PMZ19244.1 hypothetical protein C1Y09_25035 [Pseudomonas sp. FW306-02-F08-AA]
MRKIWLYTIALLVGGPAYAEPIKAILNCPFSDGTHASLLATSTLEGQKLFLKVDGNIQSAFSDMPNADFVGQIVMAKCVASGLIFALNYGTPYSKGVLLRKNPISHATERIDFSEKALPRWLYVGREQMRLVIPNSGHEVAAKFLVYDFVNEKGQPEEVEGVDTLPDKLGFKVLRLK